MTVARSGGGVVSATDAGDITVSAPRAGSVEVTAPDASPRTVVVVCADWSVIAAGFAPDTPEPVVVTHANRVVAANDAARAVGIRVGMRRRQAQGHCAQVRVVAHDPARDARRFEPVAAALAELTPLVEISEPGVAACAARGPSRYFGGDDALTALVVETVLAARIDDPSGEPQGDGPPVRVRVGVADGPLVARLAAGRAPAGGAMVVPAGCSVAFLAPVPLRVLGPHVPDPGVLSTWLQLGLATLGDVAQLPTNAVAGRFGPDGMWVHRLARGLDPRGLRPRPVPPDVAETVHLDPPVERSDMVAFAARTAAETLVGRLAARGLACTQVIVALGTDHGETHERSWRLDGPARPSGEARSLAASITDRVRWQVDGWLSASVLARPTAGITHLVLAPATVEPAKGHQLGFWGGSGGANERVVRAVARLEALVGPDAVRVAEARGGRHPGSEVTLVPTAAIDVSVPRAVPLPGIGDDAGPGDAPWPGQLPAPSPTLVPEQPQPAELLDAEGRTVQVNGRGEIRHPPATVIVSTAGHSTEPIAVAGWAGPWLVDERWWDPDRRCRQARVQVVTVEGTGLLLARFDRQWWLTAVYT